MNTIKLVIATMVLGLVFFSDNVLADTPLAPGLNLVSGTGQLPPQYVASHPCAMAVWGWNSQLQEWTHYYPGVPDYVNEFHPTGLMLPQNGYVVLCKP